MNFLYGLALTCSCRATFVGIYLVGHVIRKGDADNLLFLDHVERCSRLSTVAHSAREIAGLLSMTDRQRLGPLHYDSLSIPWRSKLNGSLLALVRQRHGSSSRFARPQITP